MSSNYKSGLRVSEYVLEECVGTGSFAEVWRARHHIWENDRVAVKLPIEPEYVRYLQREGVVVHGLKHPNIVRVLGLDPYADTPYMVMELINGPSLRTVVNEHPTGLAVDIALTIMRGILSAMSVAHEASVLHRDLKPGNILLDLDGKPIEELAQDDVKVSDFGLGIADPETLKYIVQSASIDRENKLVGTMAYMAPEIRDGHGAVDARSDLYAIGVIMFELLTGTRPAGAELPGTLRAEAPSALDDVFRRLYARYENRYESAAAALEDLDKSVRPVGAPLPSLPVVTDNGARQTCHACGNVVDPGDQFCTQCGGQVVSNVRRCPSCGGYPGTGDDFCIFCGERLAPTGA